jgi:hypothetical protein
MSARGRLTCRDAMLCARRSHRIFGLVLCILSLAPAPGQALEHAEFAYVVSPPPATRQTMPNYLPKLPPESTAGIPLHSAHSPPRLRAGCQSCQLRPRHLRRCAHCRHRAEHPAASHRRTGHRAYHRRGHFDQHRRHVPRHHSISGRNRSAPRRWHSTLGSLAQCHNAMDEIRRCLRAESSLLHGTHAARCAPRSGETVSKKMFGSLATRTSRCDWNLDTSLRAAGCCFLNRNLAAMNQQVAIIDLRKPQLSPTSAAVLCHFISASDRTRGAADWRPGGT